MSLHVKTTIAIAQAIAPLLESAGKVKSADRELVAAVVHVADAVTRLEQTRYTAAEKDARSKLERAAVSLRTRHRKWMERK